VRRRVRSPKPQLAGAFEFQTRPAPVSHLAGNDSAQHTLFFPSELIRAPFCLSLSYRSPLSFLGQTRSSRRLQLGEKKRAPRESRASLNVKASLSVT
jgi:hypothetical protein